MRWTFPTERELKRRVLLEAVESIRQTLTACADAAETHATLPAAAVEALYHAGLFALKLPAVCGGAEADPITQFEVIETVTSIDASTAWCMMIGATSIAMPAAFLSDAALEQVFIGGQVPTAAAVFMPAGTAVPVAGGYRVNGHWPFASGIHHAQWLTAGTRVGGNGSKPPAIRRIVFPAAQAQIHDNWQVAGLQGTGSCDFSVTDLFVPETFTWDATHGLPQRGGALYHLGMPGFVANEHMAFALGVGRRALDTVIAMAESKRRGFKQPSALAARPAFQRVVGECDLRLRAARALAIELYDIAWGTVCDGRPLPPQMQAELRSTATFATEVALDVVTAAFRYAGGSALYLSNILQRCLRDINAAAQHLVVSNVAYENHGQFVLGFPDADPMG